MRRAARFNQNEATRLMKAMVAAGLEPSSCEVAPDGTLRVLTDRGQPVTPNSFDRLLAGR